MRESGQQETGWSSHLIEGRANYIDWCNKNPAAELFKSWTALKARVLADNNTGHFRAEDKSLCNYDLKETCFPQFISQL